MYKLLLIDDERIVRESISQLIHWEQYDINLIGSCSNAIEALEIVKENRPDIIITDIRMPVINGIDFIKNIRSQGIDSECIILSGYNEFEFAKNAMQENVKHYILKPCSEREIEDALLKTISDINSKRIMKKKIEAQQFVQHIYLQQFIHLVLQRKELDTEMEHGLRVLFSEYDQLFWISFQWEIDLQNPQEIYQCFLDFAQATSATLISSVMKINTTLGCFYFSSKHELPFNQLMILQKQLYKHLHYMPVLNETKKCCLDQLYSWIKDIFNDSSGYMVITDKGISQCEIKEAYSDLDFASIQDKMVKTITQGDRQSIHCQVQSLFYTYDRNFAMMVCTKLLIKYSYAGLLDKNYLTTILNQVYAIKEIHVLMNTLSDVMSNLHVDDKNESFVDKIIKYIHENLEDSNLTLKWCAKELVFLNEDYISRAFTKQTGENFSTYLNHIRIERAKVLISLMSENDKIYTVAEKIGLGHNPQYFSRLFKKNTGYTPKEYKELYS